LNEKAKESIANPEVDVDDGTVHEEEKQEVNAKEDVQKKEGTHLEEPSDIIENDNEDEETTPDSVCNTGVPETEDQESNITKSEDLPDELDDQVSEAQDEEWDVVPPARKSARVQAGVRPPSRYDNYAFHLSLHKGLKTHGKDAYAAAKEELVQLWKDKKTMLPVKKEDLTPQQQKKTIRSLMFLKEKYDGLGRFEKMKARLVANGAQQDRNIYEHTSSPTVAMQSIMMGLTIAAKEKRNIAVADIKGAYLNADMTEEVHMELEPMLTRMIVNISPEAKEYVDNRGRLTVRLDKALYGCVQSARLWYNTLTGYLEKIGFKKNESDKCVLNKIVDGEQLTVMVYVDDLLITCASQDAINELANQLRAEYGEIKLQQEMDMSYLGMHLITDKDKSKVKLSMKTYIENVLQEYPVKTSVSTPANNNLFSSPINDKKLTEESRKEFHSMVAKLLYLAKRTRPDILLAVTFLCTKVKDATESDKVKLERVLKYLKGTKDFQLELKGTHLEVRGFIDASFGCHVDGKSHTGLAVTVGETNVLCQSSKQKIVTRDSTEAELVGLSDKMNEVIKCWEFMINQGYQDLPPPTIFQDNQSTIELVVNGNGKYRTKYMRVRQGVVMESIQRGEMNVEYKPTREMLADVLTKPLQGDLFFRMTSGLLSAGLHPDVTGVRCDTVNA